MAAEVVDISIRARLDEFEKAIKTLPGISAREAKLMVQGLQRELRKAEKSAKDTAKNSEKAWKDAGQGMKAALSQVGGVAGQLGGIMFEIGEKAGSAAGAVGLAGVAFTAAAIGAKAIADESIEARDRLIEMGLAALIPEESLRSIEDYEKATKSLSTQVDLLKVQLGTQLTPALTDATNAASGALTILDRLSSATGPEGAAGAVGGVAMEVAKFIPGLGSLATGAESVGRAMGVLADVGEATGVALQQASWSADDLYESMGMLDTSTRGSTKSTKETVKAGKEARTMWDELADGAHEVNAAIKAEREEEERLRKARADATNEQIRAIGAAREHVAMQAELDAVSQEMAATLAELEQRMQAYSGSWQQMGDVAQQVSAEVGAALESGIAQQIGSVMGSIMQLNDMANAELLDQGRQQVDAAMSRAETERDHAQERLDRMRELGQLSRGEAQAEQQRINAEYAAKRDAAKKLDNDERKAVMKNFRMNRSLQITQAVIEGARAAVALIPAFSFLGPFAPVAAAGVAAPATALQIAVIKKQKPPEFPTGGMVTSSDHVAIGAQVGEGVLSRRAVDQIGGPRAVDRLNGGQAVPGLQPVVVVQLGRRTLAEAVADTTGTARPDPRYGQADHGSGW